MILTGVEYQVFPHDVSVLSESEAADWHQLDGQVKMSFSDAPPIFISWASTPVQYSIAMEASSFFNSESLVQVAMTGNIFWKTLIGTHVSATHVDGDHQVLCLSNAEKSVFLSSQCDNGSFFGDCVRVSITSPI